MTAILRVDNYSLFPFIRIGEGEGFTPTSGDKVAPDFAQSGLSEGQPLIDINEDNGEFVIPVHLNADATARTNLWTAPATGADFDSSADYALTTVDAVSEGVEALFGANITKHTYDGANSGDSNSGTFSFTFPAAGTYTISTHVWFASTVAGMSALLMNTDGTFAGSSGETQRSALVADGTGKWLRMSTTVTVVGGDLTGFFTIRRTGAGSTVAEGLFYTAGTQVELASAPTKFISGYQGGCYWNGTPGASTSTSFAGRQGLADLEKHLNRLLDAAQFIEWQDEGLTYSTFYKVVYARWEPEYRYRRAGARWMTGTIRAWTKPYGQATSGNGSMIASSGVPSLYPFASMLLPTQMGDIDSELLVHSHYSHRGVSVPSSTVFGLSVLPNASYRAFSPAASLIPSHNALYGLSLVSGASGAAASQCIVASHIAGNSGFQSMGITAAEVSIPNAVAQPGNHRVLITLRSRTHHGLGVRAFMRANGTIGPIGPTAVATLHDWHLLDLGVFRVSTQMVNQMGEPITISVLPGGLASGALGASTPYPTFAFSSSYAASGGFVHINSMYVVPEDTTILIDELTDTNYDSASGALGMPNSSMMVDSSRGIAWYRNARALHNNEVSEKMRGEIPRVAPGAQRALIAFWSPQRAPQAVLSGATNAYVAVTTNERFRFAR
jgi:hypothetical protein